MNWRTVSGVLLLANAAAHVVSAQQIQQSGGPDQERNGVAAFAGVYGLGGVLMLSGVSWAPRLVQATGGTGMSGLLSTWSSATAPRQTNGAILALDAACLAAAALARRQTRR